MFRSISIVSEINRVLGSAKAGGSQPSICVGGCDEESGGGGWGWGGRGGGRKHGREGRIVA